MRRIRIRAAISIFSVLAVLVASAVRSSLPALAESGVRAKAQSGQTASSPRTRAVGQRSPGRKSTKRRAAPPAWDQDVLDVFFPDARKLLPGGIPSKASVVARSDATRAETRTAAGRPSTPEQSTDWSKLISREALEDEIKLLAPQLAEEVSSARQFRGGGFRTASQQLGLLAVLFGVAAQYDGDIRWKQEAAGLRDLLSTAAAHCQTPGNEAYQEAKLRSADLTDLVRGGRVEVPQAEPATAWAEVAQRRWLMTRLEIAQRDRLAPWTASETEFERHSDAVVREAEIVAMLSHIIAQDGYDYADDEEYREFAEALKRHGVELIRAAQEMRFADVQAAVAGVTKSCGACHDDYR